LSGEGIDEVYPRSVPTLPRLIIAAALAALSSAAANDIVGRAPLEPAASASASASASVSGLGINLEQPRYWLSDSPFINEFKRAGGWFTSCDSAMPQCRDFVDGANESNTAEQSKLELDADGWVKRLPAADEASVKFRSVSALLFQGNGGAHAPGRYVVRYDGEGQIEYAGAGKRVASASRPGRDVVEVGNATNAGLTIRLKRIAPGDHLRNIRVIPPGGVCMEAPQRLVADPSACRSTAAYRSLEVLESVQVFHPTFLADLRGFRAIRFMQWTNVIHSTLARWDDRPRPNDAFWSSDRGVPYELMLALAARLGSDPWLNVTPYVDDDHVRRLARLARERVAAPRLLYFEYGNEPWNGAMPFGIAGAWYEQQARKKWPSNATNASAIQLRMNWYAYRAVQLCRIVKSEFGADAKRVRCVANGQASNAAVSNWMLDCELARAELGGRCSRDFDTLSIAPYFGFHVGLPDYGAQTDRWPDQADGGLATLFQELTGQDGTGRSADAPLYSPGDKMSPGGALSLARGYMLQNKKIADKHGLVLSAYEGGQHLVSDRPRLAALFAAANRDPRMGRALTRHLDDWRTVGGQLYMPYTHVKRSGRSGSWGLKEHQHDDESVKWQAVSAARDQPCWWSGCTR
jgi:hypothetical protein